MTTHSVVDGGDRHRILSATTKDRLSKIAGAAVLLAAWALPVYYAVVGIEWAQGAGATQSLPPANWATAEDWATRTLWIGAAAFASMATVAVTVAALRGKTRHALGFASTMILIEIVWFVAGLTYIGVILNALVMN